MTKPRTNFLGPLPPLDLPTIQADAEQWVADRLADCPDAASVVRTATQIIHAQSKPFERNRMKRDRVALSIREYGPDATEPVPVNIRHVRLAEATGVSRPRLQTLRDAWDPDTPIPLVPNARRELPKLAKATAIHEYRVDAARDARDEAILELIDTGWRNTDIASLMDRDPSRAAHLRYEKQVLEWMDEGMTDHQICVALNDGKRPTAQAKASLMKRLRPVRKRWQQTRTQQVAS